MSRSLRLLPAILLLIAALLTSCSKADNQRVPPYPVRLGFIDIGRWELSGVTGAATGKLFVKSLRIPSNYPYTAVNETGFGGVYLVTNYMGEVLAYDAACPVELKPDVRVQIIDGVAVCPVCHSEYDIFQFGQALKGEAANNHWDLRPLRVLMPGPGGEYCYVTQK